jgi:hypothetical protein
MAISNYERSGLARILATDTVLYVVSGEGEQGTREQYEGKRTVRAVLARLTREACGGDRWARLVTEQGETIA